MTGEYDRAEDVWLCLNVPVLMRCCAMLMLGGYACSADGPLTQPFKSIIPWSFVSFVPLVCRNSVQGQEWAGSLGQVI
jgi:hypothetical protein